MVTRFVPTKRQTRAVKRQREREAEVAASRERTRQITAAATLEPEVAPPVRPRRRPPAPPSPAPPTPGFILDEATGQLIPSTREELLTEAERIERLEEVRFAPEVLRLISTLHPKLFPEIPEEDLRPGESLGYWQNPRDRSSIYKNGCY